MTAQQVTGTQGGPTGSRVECRVEDTDGGGCLSPMRRGPLPCRCAERNGGRPELRIPGALGVPHTASPRGSGWRP